MTETRNPMVGLARQAESSRDALLRPCLTPILPQLGFTDEAVGLAAQHMKLRVVPAGERIIAADDRTQFVHLVVTGSVRLVCNVPGRGKAMVGLLGPGRFFGLASTFDRRGPRLLGAEAHARSVVGVLSYEAALQILDVLPPDKVFQLLASSWRALSSIIYHKTRALRLPLRERLLEELRQLTCDFGRPHPRGLLLDVSLRHADLAALLGCSRANVGRALHGLRQAGLIDDVDGRVLLLDLQPATHAIDAASPSDWLRLLAGAASRRDASAAALVRQHEEGFLRASFDPASGPAEEADGTSA
jgi:CRP/FNR family transcriptional regulator, cyclic AMP receptor protein